MPDYRKKEKVLVTGGAGFIGSHVVDELVKMNQHIVILDDLTGGYRKNINKKSTFVKGSINNEKLLDRLFRQYRFDYVFHLAAYAAEGLSHFIRKFNYENNLIGSINLINRSVLYDVKRFVFSSSIAVYGANQSPMREDMIPHPEDPYGIAKYAIEMDLNAANQLFGLNYTIFRPHNVYGERQNHGDPYRNVLGIFINNIMMGKPMTIFGDGHQTRAFSYIGDVAPHIARCITIRETGNEIYNIGADQPYTVLQLAKTIATIMGIKAHIKFLPARKEVIHVFSDHTKTKKVFGIRKTISLEEGIRRMVKWAKEIGPLPVQKFRQIEVYKNMPLAWRQILE